MLLRKYGSIALAMTLLSTPALAYDPMGDEESFARFGEAVRSYIVQNPEILLEAQQALQARQEALMVERDAQMVEDNLVPLLENPLSPVYGDPDAEFTVVKFNDYFCGFCRNASGEIIQFLEERPDTRIVIKEFPILGPNSDTAARFAVAVNALGGQGAYEAVKPMLFSADAMSEEYLERMIATTGLAAEDVFDMMDGPEVSQYLAATHALAREMEVTGTPAFVMGDLILRGSIPAQSMTQLRDDIVGQ